jgi:hypothetical protein
MLRFLWTPEIIEHIARHGISPGEFEQAVQAPVFKGWSTTNPTLSTFGAILTRTGILAASTTLRTTE